MTRTRLILAGLIAGAMAFGTACKSDKAAEMPPPSEPPAEQGETPTPPPTDQTTPPPGGTGGAGDLGVDDFGEPIPGTGTPIPDDYGGSGTMNPEHPGTGGSGDLPQDDVIQDDATIPDSAGDSGLLDDQGTGGSGTDLGTPDTGDVPQTQDKDTQDKTKAKEKEKYDPRGTGGSGSEDESFGGDSFPSDNERVNDPEVEQQ